MSLLGPSIPLAFFLSCFPAVFGTIGLFFIYLLVVSFPMAKARKEILRESKDQFLTEQVIERELANRHPNLYNIQVYMVPVMFGCMFVLYILSVLIITIIGASIHVSW